MTQSLLTSFTLHPVYVFIMDGSLTSTLPYTDSRNGVVGAPLSSVEIKLTSVEVTEDTGLESGLDTGYTVTRA